MVRRCSSPLGLWVPWQPRIWSAVAYLVRRPAMRHLLDLYMPGVEASVIADACVEVQA